MEDIDRFSQLPEECISRIIALTPVKDTCGVAAVSRIFRSMANSDPAWEARLPSNIKKIILQSSPPSLSQFLNSLSLKDLYLHLSHHPLLIGTGNTSFALEKESGKVCYMIGAKDLKIVWYDATSECCYWESAPESRFPQVAKLKNVRWLEIEGRIKARELSLKTNYAAYFVFKLSEEEQGHERRSVKLRVYFKGNQIQKGNRVFLDPRKGTRTQIRERKDGWMEVNMGEIYNHLGDGLIIFSLHELLPGPYQGLFVEGIEIRPHL